MASKNKKNATLVGFFLFLGLVCLGVMVAQFGNIAGRFGGDYSLNVVFPDASGLVKDSDVTYGGARVGRVTGRPMMRPDGLVEVVLSIKGEVKVPVGSQFSIYSVSLLGDKAISIKPPEKKVDVFLEDGDTVNGGGGGGLDDIAKEAQNIARNANEAIKDFRRIAGKLETKMEKVDSTIDSFDTMMAEFTKALKSINESVLAKENTDSIKKTIANIEKSSNAIRETSQELKPIFTDARDAIAVVKKATLTAETTFTKASDQIDALGPALKEVPATLKNLREASAKATVMMDKVAMIADDAKQVMAKVNNSDGLFKTLTSDKALKEDTKAFVKNLKEYGVLRYRDAPTEKKADPKRDRFRGDRR